MAVDRAREATGGKAQTAWLVPPDTLVEGHGKSAPLALAGLEGQQLLVILRIIGIIEQESLDLAIWGSTDGTDWGAAPLFSYPQKFYLGITPAALDLRGRLEVRFLEARWSASRWGRGNPRPYFRISVEVQPLGP